MRKIQVFSPSLFAILALLVLSAFVLLSLSLAFSRGVCCGDDAYHADIAKNLAFGQGYTSSLPARTIHFNPITFDPGIGTGPTIILPAALFIKIFDNTYWAPGLANIFLWTTIMILIGVCIRKYDAGSGYLLFIVSFLWLSYVFLTRYFELWYALFGEIPAALLILLGIFLYLHDQQPLIKLASGAVLGFAILAKPLASLAVGVSILVIILFRLLEKRKNPGLSWIDACKPVLILVIGLIIPNLLFEIWKYIALGFTTYFSRWQTFWFNLTISGLELDSHLQFSELILLRVKSLVTQFGFYLFTLPIVLTLVWILIRRDHKLSIIYLVLTSIIIAHTFWWLFLAISFPRYFVISLIIVISVMGLPFLFTRLDWRIKLIYSLIIILFSLPSWSRLGLPFEEFDGRIFTPTPRTLALLESADVLSTAAEEEQPVVTQNWATGVDFDYIMDDPPRIIHYAAIADVGGKPFWLAINRDFMNASEKRFVALMDSCKSRLEYDEYFLGKFCDPGAMQ